MQERADAQARSDAQATLESDELRDLRLAEESWFHRGGSSAATQSSALQDHLLEPAVAPVPLEALPVDGRPGWLARARMPDIDVAFNGAVVHYLDYFRSDVRGRAIIRAWHERQQRYARMIRAKLQAASLPEDLLYVAMVESGFDPRARSNQSAAGLWQFVPGTGEEFGLTRNHWVDLRLDPERSTDAALQYLSQLHTRFGTWELAFAAYNMGYGALLRAIRAYGTNDYYRLAELEGALPYETTLYVAKILACALVGRNPELFGLQPISNSQPNWDTVEVHGGVGFGLIARAAATTDVAIRDLNPQFLRGRTPPTQESFRIRVPVGASAQFARQLARLEPRVPLYRNYAVRFGDSLALIAARFNTNVRALRELNQWTDGDVIPTATPILVPNVEPNPASELRDQATAFVPERAFSYPNRERYYYRARAGDTVAAIARFFAVAESDLVAWNVIAPRASLQEGTWLQVFLPASFDLSRAVLRPADDLTIVQLGSAEYFQAQAERQGLVRVLVRVAAGDTLGGIAQRFGVRTGALVRLNTIPESQVLQLGQEIVVYAERRRIPTEYRTQLPAEAHASQTNTTTAAGANQPTPSTSTPGATDPDTADRHETTVSPQAPGGEPS